MLEEAGYKVLTHTDDKSKVTAPRRVVIVFKRDVGVCNHMRYIDLREHAKGLVMLETVEKNIEIFTEKEIERAQLARAVHRRIEHPTDEYMKTIVSQRSLKNIPIRVSDIIANTKALFGTTVPGLKGGGVDT